MFIKMPNILLIFSLFLGSWMISSYADSPVAKQLPTAAGSFLLVATRQMHDPRFSQTVLVVTRHGKGGPIGVIINRPEDKKLDAVFPALPAAKSFGMYYGGPAYPRQISYLIRGAEKINGALTLSASKGIYLAYDKPMLSNLIAGKRQYKDLRVMHGLASWAPGQLEQEIRGGDWVVLPFDEAIVFDHPITKLWLELSGHSAVL